MEHTLLHPHLSLSVPDSGLDPFASNTKCRHLVCLPLTMRTCNVVIDTYVG